MIFSSFSSEIFVCGSTISQSKNNKWYNNKCRFKTYFIQDLRVSPKGQEQYFKLNLFSLK